MKYTANLQLKKPDYTDPADIADINTNMDKIDTELAQMAKDYVRSPAYGKTAGTATAYTLTLNPAPTAYVDGMNITIVPHVDCGANPTLKINSLTALTILRQDGTALKAGDMKANKPYSLVRVGSNFFIRSGGIGGNIKSIQRGEVAYSSLADSVSKSITISAVDLSCAIIIVEQDYYPVSYEDAVNIVKFRGSISNATTILLERYYGQNLSYSSTGKIYWTVIEFENVKSLQKGSVQIKGAYTSTITAVDMDKAIVFYSFSPQMVGTSIVYHEAMGRVILSNSTTVSFNAPPDSYLKINYQVLEFN